MSKTTSKESLFSEYFGDKNKSSVHEKNVKIIFGLCPLMKNAHTPQQYCLSQQIREEVIVTQKPRDALDG